MLIRNLSKKIGMGVLLLSMLLGTLGVNAKHQEAVYKDAVIPVFKMNFNNYDTASKSTSKNEYRTFDGNSDIEFRDPKGWGGSSAAIKEGTDASDKYFSATIGCGIKVKFKPNEGTTLVSPGDIIKISFKYKWDTAGALMGINLNDNDSYRFQNISGGTTASSTTYGTLATIVPGQKKLTVAEAYDGNGLALADITEWSDVEIVINTADQNADGDQTLKVTTNGHELYGKYDAAYTGDGDTTFDKFTNIDAVYLDTMGQYGGVSFMIDDLETEITTKVAEPVYISDLIKSLAVEDFSGMSGEYSVKGWGSKLPIEGISLTAMAYGTNSESTITADYPTEGSEKAFKIKIAGGEWLDHRLYLDDPSAKKTLESGDVLVYKFDYYQEKQDSDFLDGGFNVKFITDGDKRLKFVLKDYTYINWTGGDPDAIIVRLNNGVIVPGFNGSVDEARKSKAGKWYTVEIVVDTCDVSPTAQLNKIAGNQTLSMKLIDKESGDIVVAGYGTLDADPGTADIIDPLTEYNAMVIGFAEGANDNTMYIDNVSSQILRQGVEAFGEAVDGISADDSKFVSGKTISVQALAGAADYSENNNKVNVFVAQYGENNALLDVKMILGEANGKLIKFDDITPLSNAAGIKLFMFEDNTLVPLTDAKAYTQLNSSKPAD